jgi:hypoxanthine phosphoribosyltransferase
MDLKTRVFSWKKFQNLTNKLAFDILKSNWRPDYIVGILRGGAVPAVMLSHILEVPMYGLKVSLRDDKDCETNCWMPEDLIGGKKILLVDDINDSGATFKWIQEDWYSNVAGVMSQEDWTTVCQNNLRSAVLVDNLVSDFFVDFYGLSVNKNSDPRWIVFPWETH